MKFRRKPEYVETVQLTQDAVTAHVLDKTPLPDGCYVSSYNAHPPTRVVSRAIVRLRNPNRDLVMPGDWIIRSADGVLSVVKPDVFDAMYEVADPIEPLPLARRVLAQIIRADWRGMTGIRVIVDGEVIGTGEYGGEPEDNSEYRDYKWVKELLVTLAKKLGASASIESVEVDGPTERAASEAYYAAMTAAPTSPVDHAIATEPCTKCGAAIGIPCKVEIRGLLHDGAHHARLDAAFPRKT